MFMLLGLLLLFMLAWVRLEYHFQYFFNNVYFGANYNVYISVTNFIFKQIVYLAFITNS